MKKSCFLLAMVLLSMLAAVPVGTWAADEAAFKAKLKPQDELWYFMSPRGRWQDGICDPEKRETSGELCRNNELIKN